MKNCVKLLPDLVLNLCMCHAIWTEPARASAELDGNGFIYTLKIAYNLHDAMSKKCYIE